MTQEVKSTEKLFGVAEIAKTLGVKPNVARIRLRAAKIKRNGKNYSFKTKAEVDAIVKKLKAA